MLSPCPIHPPPYAGPLTNVVRLACVLVICCVAFAAARGLYRWWVTGDVGEVGLLPLERDRDGVREHVRLDRWV